MLWLYVPAMALCSTQSPLTKHTNLQVEVGLYHVFPGVEQTSFPPTVLTSLRLGSTQWAVTDKIWFISLQKPTVLNISLLDNQNIPILIKGFAQNSWQIQFIIYKAVKLKVSSLRIDWEFDNCIWMSFYNLQNISHLLLHSITI